MADNSKDPRSLSYIIAACDAFEKATRARVQGIPTPPNISRALTEVDNIRERIRVLCLALTDSGDPPSDNIVVPPAL